MNGMPRMAVMGMCIVMSFANTCLCDTRDPDLDDGDLAIIISPCTIMECAQLRWLTVHTNVQKSTVTSCTMTVNGTAMSHVCVNASSQGNLVVRVPFEDVVDIVSPSWATIELALETKSEEKLALSAKVRVEKCNHADPDPGDGDFAIAVAPCTIVECAPLRWLTVHTNVQISDVVEDSWVMTVDATIMPRIYVYTDSLGNLVAKMPFEDVVEVVSPQQATIKLELETKSGDKLAASAKVKVRKCDHPDPDPDDGDFAIYISPFVIVKGAPLQWLTVHTNVQLSDVEEDSWIMTVDETVMSGVYVYADLLGNLVAKAPFEDVVEVVSPKAATIKLQLKTSEGELVASDVVRVKEVASAPASQSDADAKKVNEAPSKQQKKKS